VLMDYVLQSNSRAEFLRRAEAPGSVWTRMTNINEIHEGVLDKELTALEPMARGASISTLHIHMTRNYGLSGLLPDPDHFAKTFSAAVEFLKSAVAQVRSGAKPKKNDRGMYVDSQFFWYLADPNAVLVTNEDFSDLIKQSHQRKRIIKLADYLRL
jgi:hypothetical protein